VNAGETDNADVASGYLHIDSFLPEKTDENACELEPDPEDGFLWFLNLAWHWVNDPNILEHVNDTEATVPLALKVLFGEEGLPIREFPRMQFKAPATFVERSDPDNSGLGTMLNLSQIVCKWPHLSWHFPQHGICDVTLPSGKRVLVLDPQVFGLADEHWSVCPPQSAIKRMRRQYEVFIDRLAVLCNQKRVADKKKLPKLQAAMETPVFTITTDMYDWDDVAVNPKEHSHLSK
jgi:hypothetical protein